MDLSEILENPPLPHKDAAGEYFSMGIEKQVLDFILDHIDSSSRTLETGCGVSTVMFALSGAHHICVTPAADEIERVLDYCRGNDIVTDGIAFHADLSENILPSLVCDPLDLVLIDGRHGFPAPFIDFYYTASKLKIEGLLVIDDTWLWTGEVLKQILSSEPEWKLEADFSPRTSVFRKLAEGSQSKEWTEQSFVVNHSAFKLDVPPPSYLTTAARYLKRREFSLLGRKIVSKIARGPRPA